MDVIPMGLPLIDHQPLPARQRPPSQLRYLPGHALSGAGAETVDAAGTDDCCPNAFGSALEDYLVNVAVPGLVGKIGNFIHMIKVIINLGGKLFAEAIGAPVEKDRGARSMDEIAWGRPGAQTLNNCGGASFMVVVGSV